MTKLVSMIVALGLAFAFTAPTFAADVTTAKTKAFRRSPRARHKKTPAQRLRDFRPIH